MFSSAGTVAGAGLLGISNFGFSSAIGAGTFGTPVTHVGDEKGLAPVAEEKPALEIPNIPAPIAEEKPKLEIPSKPAPATVPAEENKALPQGPAPVAKENKLPETGSQGSEWLIATGLMAALTAYGLSKKKD